MPTVTVDGEKSFEVEAGRSWSWRSRTQASTSCTAAAGTRAARPAAWSSWPAKSPRWSHSSKNAWRAKPTSSRTPASRVRSACRTTSGSASSTARQSPASRRHAAAGLIRDRSSRAATSLDAVQPCVICASAARRISCIARCAGAPGRRSANSDDTLSLGISSCGDGMARRTSRGGTSTANRMKP